MSEEASTPEAEPVKSYSENAKEFFGSNYYGEVKETPKETPAETPEAQDVELQPEDAPVVETDVETENLETAAPEENTISTMQQLIESSEFDPEWFNSLEVAVKVDGEPSSAKLSDVVKSYQMTQAAEKRLDDAKEKAKVQYQALAEKQTQLDQTFQVAAQVLQRQKAKIDTEAGQVDWNKLRVDDPAEWSAKRQEFVDRKASVDAEIREIATAFQQHTGKIRLETENTNSTNLMAESKALLEKLPEWNNEEVATKEKAAVGEYLISQGLTHEEVSRASDHRIVIMARKAMLFDQLNAKTEPAKKKLAMVPKTLKSGSPKTQSDINHTQEQGLLKTMNANPNSREAEEAGMALMKLRRNN